MCERSGSFDIFDTQRVKETSHDARNSFGVHRRRGHSGRLVDGRCFVGACCRAGTGDERRPADLVLTNGTIVTVNDQLPEAQAMAVSGDTITALGSNQDIQRYVGPNTNVIDLKGALARPDSWRRTRTSRVLATPHAT